MLRIKEHTACVHKGTYEISVSMCKSTVATTAVYSCKTGADRRGLLFTIMSSIIKLSANGVYVDFGVLLRIH